MKVLCLMLLAALLAMCALGVQIDADKADAEHAAASVSESKYKKRSD